MSLLRAMSYLFQVAVPNDDILRGPGSAERTERLTAAGHFTTA
jgi:hypothetical protein